MYVHYTSSGREKEGEKNPTPPQNETTQNTTPTKKKKHKTQLCISYNLS